MANIAPELMLTKSTYSDASVRSLPDYADIMEAVPKLSQEVIHLAFNSKEYARKNFPMIYSTKGAGKIKTIPSGYLDWRYGVIGKPKKTSLIARSLYSATDIVGRNGATFTVPFKDGFFSPQSTITKTYAGEYYNLRVQGMERVNGEFLYTFTYLEANPTKSVPIAILAADTAWAEGIVKVPYQDSDGTLSKFQTYGEATNALGIYRHGMKMVGNPENIAMVYSIPVNGKIIRFAQDWEVFQMELSFQEKLEFEMWTSKYGKNASGEIVFKDIKTDGAISSGAGIDQQIINSDTYSTLTYQKWNNLIRHVMFNIKDTDGLPVLDVYTGTLGMERVHEMLANKASGFTAIANNAVGDKIVSGEGYNLTFGAYFNAFRHVDGYLVNFIKHSMFDRGLIGESSDIDPTSSLPESSGYFYFIDRSTYEGKNNILYVESEGFPYITNTVTGVGHFSKKFGGGTTNRAHAKHSAELHGIGSGGIQIMNPSTCFKLKYVRL